MQKNSPSASIGKASVAKINNQFAKLKKLAEEAPKFNDDIAKYDKLFTTILAAIESSGFPLEQLEDIILTLYTHLKRLKQQIIAKTKFQSYDVELFKQRYKQYKKPFLPFLDELKLIDNNAKPLDSISIEDLSKISFDHLSYTEEQLCSLSFTIFKSMDIHEKFNVSDSVLKGLLREIADNYNVVPYHHFTHAFSVFQMLFCVVQQTNVKQYLGDVELFAGMMAALVHDMNHRGVGNAWHLKEKSDTAVIFADRAVMENLHIGQFFRIMKSKPEYAIIDGIKDPNLKMSFKRLLVTNVLATDMSKHNQMVAKLTKRTKCTKEYNAKIGSGMEIAGPLRDFAFLSERFEDRRYISNALIHACDIGNPCLPYETYVNWGALITQEFDSQTIKEEKHGLEVTGFLKCKSKEAFLNSQVFFCKSMVYPLWQQINMLVKGLDQYLKNIDENVKKLRNDKEKLIKS